MSGSKRSNARVLALQALCSHEVLGPTREADLDEFLSDGTNYADLGWKMPPAPEVLRFARELVTGVWAHQPRYDDLLREHVAGWSVERMQPVDRNILRLGLFELLEAPETPPAVVINEAVELARRFGSAESPAFVNGVLDGMRKALMPESGDKTSNAAAQPTAPRTTD